MIRSIISSCGIALTLLFTSEVRATEPYDVKAARAFLDAHCVRCHNAKSAKGKFTLDDLPDVAERRSSYAAVLERLRAGDMPPKGEPQPDAGEVRRVTDWIQSNLTVGTVGPSDGNLISHSLLFGGKPGPSVPPPPRLWRLSPVGYQSLVKSVRVRPDGYQLPFGLLTDAGIKDYAALYRIDEGSTDLLLRNAEKIVAHQTAHKLVPLEKPQGHDWPPKERALADAERDALKDGVKVRLDYPHEFREFAPLVHPKIAPNQQELEAAIRFQYRLALVRDPSPKELQSLLTFYEKGVKLGDRVAAAKMVLMAPLLSPEALHRFEIGRGAEVRPGVRMLSPDEIAFAVSLTLSSRREAGLFEAAKKGELKTREEVAKHVLRIWDDEKIPKPRLLGFFQEYFGYDRATDVFKDPLPGHVHNPRQFVLDTDLLILTILERDKDVLKELLTTKKSFAHGAEEKPDNARDGDDPTAWPKNEYWPYKLGVREKEPVNPHAKGKTGPTEAYGFAKWPAAQPAELPGDRIGILMQPSWLVAWSQNLHNDPVRRGRWVRERLLGGRVPDLPINVQAVIPEDPHRTLRERQSVTRAATCWKCHKQMDDLGLPFEAFDHFGRPRLAESVLDLEATAQSKDKKKVYRDAPLDTTGRIEGSGVPGLDGAVKDAAEMLRKLAATNLVRQVFIRHVFRYYLGRNETPGDAATLQEAEKAYIDSGGSFKALVVSLLSSESFLYRSVTLKGAK